MKKYTVADDMTDQLISADYRMRKTKKPITETVGQKTKKPITETVGQKKKTPIKETVGQKKKTPITETVGQKTGNRYKGRAGKF